MTPSKAMELKRKFSQHFKLPLIGRKISPSDDSCPSSPVSPDEMSEPPEWTHKNSVGIDEIQWYQPSEGHEVRHGLNKVVSV